MAMSVMNQDEMRTKFPACYNRIMIINPSIFTNYDSTELRLKFRIIKNENRRLNKIRKELKISMMGGKKVTSKSTEKQTAAKKQTADRKQTAAKKQTTTKKQTADKKQTAVKK
jgi:hypothetical protein